MEDEGGSVSKFSIAAVARVHFLKQSKHGKMEFSNGRRDVDLFAESKG